MEEDMSKNRFVKTRIISARALQLSMGAPVLTNSGDLSPREIALKEYEEDVLPITAKVKNPRKLEI